MSELDESLRPFGLSEGERTTWQGLRVERRPTRGVNWSYSVQAADRAYTVNVFTPNPQTFRLRVAQWGKGNLVRQRVNAASPEDALRLGLEIVRGVRDQGLPAPEPYRSHHRHAFASFRLLGYALDPGEISARTGLQPSVQLPAPEVLQLRHLGPWRDGYWMLESAEGLDSLDLQDHIRWLLDRIEPVRDRFPTWVETREEWDREDEESYFAFIFCFWDRDAHDPHFDAPLLRRLADMRLSLGLDIYCPREVDESKLNG